MSGNSLTLVLLKTQIKNIWHMAKVNIKSEKIIPFGGIYYRNLLRKQGFLCAFTWQSHQRHSWCSQLHLQRLPVGRDNVSYVWRVPLWRWLRGRCQQKRVSPAGITWNPDTDEPHNPPGVVSIDGIIAYIENRDGNTPVKFHQADTLSRAFKLLHSYGLHIGIFRADCGSYSEDIGTPTAAS